MFALCGFPIADPDGWPDNALLARVAASVSAARDTGGDKAPDPTGQRRGLIDAEAFAKHDPKSMRSRRAAWPSPLGEDSHSTHAAMHRH